MYTGLTSRRFKNRKYEHTQMLPVAKKGRAKVTAIFFVS